MGDRSIKKETKKPKKSDKKAASTLDSAALRPVEPQPEVIKKQRKPK